jgi:Domain of unknown function (DUF4169)
MADIINLRHARKHKARTEKDQKAEANRRFFGQSKAEKKLNQAELEQAAKSLDGHKRDT